MANVAALNRELRDDTVEISEMYEKAMVNGLIEKLAEPFNTLIEDLKNVHEIQKGLKTSDDGKNVQKIFCSIYFIST
ncbi:hypothetical protein POVCU2_0096270 [Plasmodium ovale curtisi]|uniref:Uncharacterized protein n=1 Tax=Plasmodium ovale curtisi TaxID=864141 RepID=A0A1A8WVZ6_PLAOA|nr:hypothetical protein POVCU2_0096270 [Plasmodium ovale curtisi]